MEEKKFLYTLNLNYPKGITDLTYPYLKRYAAKIGADFFEINERKFPSWPVNYEKLQIYELAKIHGADRIIYLDADALVHPDMFDVTDHLSKDTVFHNGHDLAGNRWRYDDYFRRDGRHIGSCNWFAAASSWCIDLWRPLDDLTLQEAIERIFPTPTERQCGITREHLLDDYVLSRNIARFGLKFNNMVDVLQRIGRTGERYLHHEYTLTTEKKIETLKLMIEKKWKIA